MKYLKQFEKFKYNLWEFSKDKNEKRKWWQRPRDWCIEGGGGGVDTPVYIRYVLQKFTPTKLLIVCQYLSTTKNTLIRKQKNVL